MRQTKLESLLEVHINIAVGFLVSLAFWTFYIAPHYGFDVSFVQNLEVTGWFTLLAIIRGYLMRRFFNAGLHKAIHKLVKRMTSWDQKTSTARQKPIASPKNSKTKPAAN